MDTKQLIIDREWYSKSNVATGTGDELHHRSNGLNCSFPAANRFPADVDTLACCQNFFPSIGTTVCSVGSSW
jgi:hypothetical protein